MNPLNGSAPASGFPLFGLFSKKPVSDEEVQARAHQSLDKIDSANSLDRKRKIGEKFLASMEKSAESPAVKELAKTAGALSKTLSPEASSALAAATVGVMAQPLGPSLYEILSQISINTMQRCPTDQAQVEAGKALAGELEKNAADGNARSLANELRNYSPQVSASKQAETLKTGISMLAAPVKPPLDEGLLALAKASIESRTSEDDRAVETRSLLTRFNGLSADADKKLHIEAALNFKGEHTRHSEFAAMSAALTALGGHATSAAAGSIEKLLMDDCAAALSQASSGREKAEISGAYLDNIASRTTNSETARFAGAAASIVSPDFSFMLQGKNLIFRNKYGDEAADAAAKALKRLNDGPVESSDSALIELGKELAATDRTTQAALMTRKILEELASRSTDGWIKPLASAAIRLQKYPDYYYAAEYSCNKAVIESEKNRGKAGSTTQLMALTALDALKMVEEWKDLDAKKKNQSMQQIGNIFLAECASASNDQSAKALGTIFQALAEDKRTGTHELTAWLHKEAMQELSADQHASADQLLTRFLGKAAEHAISAGDGETLRAGYYSAYRICEQIAAVTDDENLRNLAKAALKVSSNKDAKCLEVLHTAKAIAQAPSEPPASSAVESLMTSYLSVVKSLESSLSNTEDDKKLSVEFQSRVAASYLECIAEVEPDPGRREIVNTVLGMRAGDQENLFGRICKETFTLLEKKPPISPEECYSNLVEFVVKEGSNYKSGAAMSGILVEKLKSMNVDDGARRTANVASRIQSNSKEHFYNSLIVTNLMAARETVSPSAEKDMAKRLAAVGCEALNQWSKVRTISDDDAVNGKRETATAFLQEIADVASDPDVKSLADTALSLAIEKDSKALEIACCGTVEAIRNGLSGDPARDMASVMKAIVDNNSDSQKRLNVLKQYTVKLNGLAADETSQALIRAASRLQNGDGIYYKSIMASADQLVSHILKPQSGAPVEETLVTAALQALECWKNTIDLRANEILKGRIQLSGTYITELSSSEDPLYSSSANVAAGYKGADEGRAVCNDALLNALSTEKHADLESVLRAAASGALGRGETVQAKSESSRVYMKKLLEDLKDPLRASIVRAALNLPEKHFYDSEVKGYTEALAALSTPLPDDVPPEITLASVGLKVVKSVINEGKAETGRAFIMEIGNLTRDPVIKQMTDSIATSPDVAGQCERTLAAIESFGDEIRALKKSTEPHDGEHGAVQHGDDFVVIDGIKLDKK